jgi:hypothetical protein
METEDDRAARAAVRASWPGGLRPLASLRERDDLLLDRTPAERMAMVWRLTLDAWALGGRELPDYARGDAPGRVLRSAPRSGRAAP